MIRYQVKSKLHLKPSLLQKMSLTTLTDLPKTSTFTTALPPDSQVPSPEFAEDPKNAGIVRMQRRVHGGFFTWVAPEKREKYKFLIASPPAVKDLGLKESEIDTELFKKIMSGEDYFKDPYPYAQAYSGHQFRTFAGQLGDGRVINLFESTSPSGEKYAVQLKGAGLTPYSRFADGKAVLRSSIREFLASEAIHALGIPTTRALALTSLPETTARRERREECAVVARMARSWVRLGNFTFAKSTGGLDFVKKLSDYVIDELLEGESNLIAPKSDYKTEGVQENKYVRMYREIVKRNAEMLAQCQAYGVLNGVLNTDNTSVIGLSMDYGPFAFMDSFNSNFTPNHDDGHLIYGYKNVPTSMWWNLVRLAEDIGELLGTTAIAPLSELSPEQYGRYKTQEQLEEAQQIVSDLVDDIGDEYKLTYKSKLDEKFQHRLGLTELRDTDHANLFQPLLDVLEEGSLDYNRFFRILSSVSFSSDSDLAAIAEKFIPSRHDFRFTDKKTIVASLSKWLEVYQSRLKSENSDESTRHTSMKSHNPKFVLRNWILDEVIENVQSDPESPLLREVLVMSTNPFLESWVDLGVDPDTEESFTGEPPETLINQTCSCSS